MTNIRFSGDIGTLQGVALALLVSGAAWVLYYRQIQHRDRLTAVSLPTLRGVAVFLLVLMLTQPVLHHRKVIGELGRLFVVIDSSRSLNVKDLDTTNSRKIQNAYARGQLKGFVDEDLQTAVYGLEHRHRRLTFLVNRSRSMTVLQEASSAYCDALDEALDELKSLDVPAEDPKATGSVTYEIWNGISGSAIAPLVKSEALNKKPDTQKQLKLFEAPRNSGDNYASRITGYLYPPKDGNYTFWIASNDQAELYLSTSDDPKKKHAIAKVLGNVGGRQWDRLPQQKSKPIALKGGQRYFIEALHKEGGGSDHLAVGWQMPDGAKEMPIPGTRLSPMSADKSRTSDDLAISVRTHLNALDKAKDSRNRGDMVPILRQLLHDGTAVLDLLRGHITEDLEKAALSSHPKLDKTIRDYDSHTRWMRMQAMLFDGDDPLIEQLAADHEVELQALKGNKLETLWRSRAGRLSESTDVPAFLASTPIVEVTDLAAALPLEVSTQKTAVLLLTDGQDNHGASPLNTAQILGQKGIPVYTVGMGSTRAPQDLAIRGITGPETVFVKDNANGTIIFSDSMNPGKSFEIRMSFRGKVLWQKALETDGSGMRTVDYQIAVEEHVKRFLADVDRDLKYQSVPMRVKVEIAEIEEDRQRKNNHDSHDLLVVTRRRRILLVEQRPRWEYRYLKSMFKRDDKWDVNCVLPQDVDGKRIFKRGKEEGMLPPDREELLKYDLIILGDVPKEMFVKEELGWLKDFVTIRGGGLILIDGRRQQLQTYAGSEIDVLLPVEWEEGPGLRELKEIALTAAGKVFAPLDLGSEKKANDAVWPDLPAPHWAASTRPVAGTETLVEVKVAERAAPMMVYRRCGSGKVFYCATGDIWRWRYRRADEFHRRFWNQIVDWTMERPFTVQDSHVSLDTGPATYNEGQTADIRVRLRDRDGRLLSKTTCEARLYKDDRLFATIPLTEDEDSGIYRARTARLKPANYTVRIRAEGIDEVDIKAESTFRVRAPISRELAELACNSTLLEEMAMHSNGAYFREEQINEILDVLKPLSSGHVVETDTALWQSYWYFAIVIILLTTDWIWRKKGGML